MTPLTFTLGTLGVSAAAGLVGSVLGLGGGVIVVPALTLLFGVDIRYAIGASVVSVIATSSGAAAAYVRDHLTNLRVAMLLEVGTTSGAIVGAFLAGVVGGPWLFRIFGGFLALSAVLMLRRREEGDEPVPPDAWSNRLRLHGAWHDHATGRRVEYPVTRAPAGLALMVVAGTASGLLGIGSGALKVLAMDLAMRLPIKVSSATSNFMIGVTAAASAGVYFARGDIDPFIAAPVAVGVLGGSLVGARLLPRLKSSVVRVTFVLVLLWIAVEMLRGGGRA